MFRQPPGTKEAERFQEGTQTDITKRYQIPIPEWEFPACNTKWYSMREFRAEKEFGRWYLLGLSWCIRLGFTLVFAWQKMARDNSLGVCPVGHAYGDNGNTTLDLPSTCQDVFAQSFFVFGHALAGEPLAVHTAACWRPRAAVVNSNDN